MENQTPQKTSPRDFFLHILHIISLYASVITLLIIAFQLTNIWIPDALESNGYYDPRQGAIRLMRHAIAWLIVVFPVFIASGWGLGKTYKKSPEKRNLKVRKWLIYLTLFIAALIIIADIISVVFNLLNGELTIKFFLKILAILITTGAVFGFYLWDVRQEAHPKKGVVRSFVYAVSVIVLAAIIAGIFVVGSPKEERTRRLDETRVNDLRSLQDSILVYWTETGMLPETFEAIDDRGIFISSTKDPETEATYEYAVTDENTFQLCAQFKSVQTGAETREVERRVPIRLQ